MAQNNINNLTDYDIGDVVMFKPMGGNLLIGVIEQWLDYGNRIIYRIRDTDEPDKYYDDIYYRNSLLDFNIINLSKSEIKPKSIKTTNSSMDCEVTFNSAPIPDKIKECVNKLLNRYEELLEELKMNNTYHKMKNVDDLFNDISERLGNLTTQGVFTIEESVKLLKEFSNKEYEWMRKNFSDNEIYEFMKNKVGN